MDFGSKNNTSIFDKRSVLFFSFAFVLLIAKKTIFFLSLSLSLSFSTSPLRFPITLKKPNGRPPCSLAQTAEASTMTTTTTTSPSASSSSPPSPTVSTSAPERFEAAEFSLTVPAGFDLAEVARPGNTPTTAEERGARGRGVAAQESPVKVRFTASSSATSSSSSTPAPVELSVIAREAAGIKPTFLQVTDISQWGDVASVAATLLPRTVTVTRASSEVVELPARDTGTVAGVVAPPPQVVYLYEFVDPRGGPLHVTLAAAARSGKIYVCAGSARGEEAGAERAEGLREAVRSFRVTPPMR